MTHLAVEFNIRLIRAVDLDVIKQLNLILKTSYAGELNHTWCDAILVNLTFQLNTRCRIIRDELI